MSQSPRIRYLDFLKTIGLMGIILAHVSPPAIIMMARDFDVPLMVIISAILAQKSYNKRIQSGMSIKTYYISRFKRLVFPTWIFLTIYFVICAICNETHESVEYYLYSFGLTRYGIGYVWIILIYLYCAALIPLFNKMPFNVKNVVIIIICYFAYEIMFYYNIGTQSRFILSTLYYIVPYGTITFIGFHFNSMKTYTKKIIALTSGIIFILLMAYYWVSRGIPQLVSIVKYPPRMYYLSYGVFCSFVLLLLCEKNTNCNKIFEHSIIKFISSHSMWIYLWHILAIKVYETLRLPSIWVVKFIFVFISAIMIVFIENTILDIICKRSDISFIKYLRG